MSSGGPSSSLGVSTAACPRIGRFRTPLSAPDRPLQPWTAKRANNMLGLTGSPFWQEESYDHLVRDQRELERIRLYIEHNPVRAGLVRAASQYRWSSAGWATGGRPRTRGSALR
jgi:hypothetical protein